MEWKLNEFIVRRMLIQQIKELERDIEYYNQRIAFYENEEKYNECNIKIEYLKGKLEGLRIAKTIINC